MILRIHSSLCRRSYLVWIDTEMMKGSTMDGENTSNLPLLAILRC